MKKELTEIEKKRLNDKVLIGVLLATPFIVLLLVALQKRPAIWEPLTAIVLMLVLVGLYFLPSSIAKNAKHPQTPAIFLLNLFLGWTFLGWVLALVWASLKTANKEGQ